MELLFIRTLTEIGSKNGRMHGMKTLLFNWIRFDFILNVVAVVVVIVE